VRIIQRLKEWLSRQPPRQRILNALDGEWRNSIDIQERAKVGVGAFYPHVIALEQDGLVESRWEEDPIALARRGGYRWRLYRLTGRKG
jgi:DNA-binding transcriptional ArsR family regulator